MSGGSFSLANGGNVEASCDFQCSYAAPPTVAEEGRSIDTKTHHGVRPSVDATAPRPGLTDSKAALDIRSSTVMAMKL
jgi:hypothetical protein